MVWDSCGMKCWSDRSTVKVNGQRKKQTYFFPLSICRHYSAIRDPVRTTKKLNICDFEQQKTFKDIVEWCRPEQRIMPHSLFLSCNLSFSVLSFGECARESLLVLPVSVSKHGSCVTNFCICKLHWEVFLKTFEVRSGRCSDRILIHIWSALPSFTVWSEDRE